MKIGIGSDLHLEFTQAELSNEEGIDVLVLAGDICVAEDICRFPFYEDREETGSFRQTASERYQKFFEDVSSEFPYVLMVMGNHEHYSGIYNKTYNILKQNLSLVSENIILLQDETFELDDVVFVGSTLWTDLNGGCPITDYHLSTMMNDYRCVTFVDDKLNYRRFRPKDSMAAHIKSVSYIDRVLGECSETGKRCVMVSHHAPSTNSIHPMYADQKYMNGGYCSDLSRLLDRSSLDLVIHGHVHHRLDYFQESGMVLDEPTESSVRVVCNPRGYPGEIKDNEPYKLKVVEI